MCDKFQTGNSVVLCHWSSKCLDQTRLSSPTDSGIRWTAWLTLQEQLIAERNRADNAGET